jgi:outer membrane lipoprotein carrier protein
MHSVSWFFLLLSINAPQTAHDLLSKVNERYQTISTIQGNFTQQTCVKASGFCQEFRGQFYIKRLNLFRLDVTWPESQLIVSDGAILWTYVESAKKVYKADVTKSQTVFSPFELLQNYEARYEYRLLPEEENLYVLRLVPKLQSPLINDLRLLIDPSSFSIKKFKIIDGMENEMVFSLSKIKYNRQITNDFFTFTPPPGVEVMTSTPGFEQK